MPEAWASRGLERSADGDAAGAKTDLEQALALAPPGSPQRARVEQVLHARAGR